MLEDVFKDIDFTNIFDNLIELYDDLRPKIIYRKIRLKGKIKKRYIYVYNPLIDLLPSPRFSTMLLRNIYNKERIWNNTN